MTTKNNIYFSYVAAAELLALSADTFESLVLKFLRPAKSSRNGLKRFLELKLNQLISNATPQSNEVVDHYLLFLLTWNKS